MNAGMDLQTGRWLSGWPHVVQCLRVIYTTLIGTRWGRRTFGSAIPGLLGRNNIAPSVLLKFATAVIVATELWEPRFKITQVTFPPDENLPTNIRAGGIGVAIIGTYRPNALAGDYTPAPTPTPYVLL